MAIKVIGRRASYILSSYELVLANEITAEQWEFIGKARKTPSFMTVI
ncbi:hypothetical protein [Parasutterella excrementihominis]